MSLSMIFLTPESLPVCRRLKIMFFHKVDYKFSGSIVRPLDCFNLFEDFPCLLPFSVDEVTEAFLEDVKEHLVNVLPHVNQVVISLEE